MSELKTYDCIVIMEDWWDGTVQAKSPDEARRCAETAFDEGRFELCEGRLLRIDVTEVQP